LQTIFSRLAEALFLTLKLMLARAVLGTHAVVRDADGRVLLVRHGYQRGWRLPGGGVDAGETPDEAIRRELHEELGLQGGSIALLGMYARRHFWIGNVVILYRIEGARLDFHPSWEIREILWADPAAPPPGLAPSAARRLAELSGAAPSRQW
jgi:8-oxo-dGTP pyrophosphatase MutT (NUDIX family)